MTLVFYRKIPKLLGKFAFHAHFYENNVLRNSRSKTHSFHKTLQKAFPHSGNHAHDSDNFAKKPFLLAKIIFAIHIILQKNPKLLENMLYTHKLNTKNSHHNNWSRKLIFS
jgi:hypothetical protein